MKPDSPDLLKPVALLREPWRAELGLAFERRDANRTVLARNAHSGPIRVQKALYPEGDVVCQTLLVHPPGGLANGDEVHLHVAVEDGAHAQVITPGAGKWYRSFGEAARWHQTLQVQAAGVLEWLPQENIVFNAAHAYSYCDIQLSGNSVSASWDILCLGCPAGGELFEQGEYASDWCVSVDGKPVWRERARLVGGSRLLQSPVGLRGRPVVGTMIFSTPLTRGPLDSEGMKAALAAVRKISAQLFDAGMLAGATTLPCGIVLRVLAYEAEHARAYLAEAWRVLRPLLMGREAVLPRIWRT